MSGAGQFSVLLPGYSLQACSAGRENINRTRTQQFSLAEQTDEVNLGKFRQVECTVQNTKVEEERQIQRVSEMFSGLVISTRVGEKYGDWAKNLGKGKEQVGDNNPPHDLGFGGFHIPLGQLNNNKHLIL